MIFILFNVFDCYKDLRRLSFFNKSGFYIIVRGFKIINNIIDFLWGRDKNKKKV